MYWYEEEIEGLHYKGKHFKYKPRTIFYGSSSLRLWDNAEKTFRLYDPINLAFGGSTLAACTWYFEAVFEPYSPESIVIYAGDNDLADGRHPEEVVLFLEKILIKIERLFGDIPVTFISIKPSKSRWHLNDSIKYTNKLISSKAESKPNFYFIDIYHAMLDKKGNPKPEYYQEDELHLSKKGYKVWQKILLNNLHIFPQPCKETITNGTVLH